MTTIAFDGTHVVADTQITGTYKQFGYKKLHMITLNRKKVIVGGAGLANKIPSFIQWLLEGADPDTWDAVFGGEEFSGVVFHADGIVDEYNEGGYPVKQSGMYAVGSGNRFAMGAMMVGATAMEAVEATKKLDVNTGGELQVFIINNGKWKAL
jgi:hypothetical protein